MKRITEFTDKDCIGYFESEEQFNQVVELCNKELGVKRTFNNYDKYTREIVIFPNIHFDQKTYAFNYHQFAEEENNTIYEASEVLAFHDKLKEQDKVNEQMKSFTKQLNELSKIIKQVQKEIKKINEINELKAHLKEVREEVRYLFDVIKPTTSRTFTKEEHLDKHFPEKKEIDFSILNDTDVFYLDASNEGLDLKYLFKVKDPFDTEVNFYDIINQCKGTNEICRKSEVIELRLATEQEKELFYTHFPEKVKLVNSNGLVIEDYAPTLAKYLEGLVDKKDEDYNVKENMVELLNAFRWKETIFGLRFFDNIDDANETQLKEIEAEFIKIKNL